jgi:hypothetical protein
MVTLLRRCLSLLLAVALTSCFGGGGGGGSHRCFPVRPLTGGPEVPEHAALSGYLADLDQRSRALWAADNDVPGPAAAAGLGLEQRQLYTYRRFVPSRDEDLVLPPGEVLLGIWARGLELEHQGAATVVAQWTGLTPVGASYDAATDLTTYRFRASSLGYTEAQVIWLANWALEQFPQCLAFAGPVLVSPHSQGGGGAI